MTKKQFDLEFKTSILPVIKADYEYDGIKDLPARMMAYNNMVDSYQKEGVLTEKQANKFIIPDSFLK